MKKSTIGLLLITFVFLIFIMVGLFVTVMVVVMQGGSPNLLGSSRLALIRVEGLIYDAEEWIDQVEEYQEDDSIKGIVVRIDSPGGAVDPSQELYNALVEAQEQYGKVVVASFGSLAASGGYYVACNADQIVSSAGSLTGSIGVYSKFPVAKELMEKIGVSYETVKAGEYKDFGSLDRGLSDKERQMMQAVIDDTYDQFVEAVLKGRKESFARLFETWEEEPPFEYPFTPDAVEIIRTYQRERTRSAMHSSPALSDASLSEATADETVENASEEASLLPEPDHEALFAFAKSISEGKVYTGRQALKIGLVDQLGSLDDSIRLAAKLAGIRGEPTVVERQKREYGLLDFLTQGLASLTARQNHSPIQYRFPY
ncbi:MAG: signal peptide peptidase SppA [Candidatus Omnitrophica bacterium]|nr:signal peptide peptidase SppA [Candidatus Omnitrophota bacterium]